VPELRITGLTVEYQSGDHTIRPFDHFELHCEPGSLVLLLGPSGCGKTTLLSALAGILRPTSGSIQYGDTEVVGLDGPDLTEYRRRGVGVVFQAFNLVPSLTATENVMIPMLSAGYSRKPAKQRAVKLLTDVGLESRLTHHPNEMSGGQQQRVAIARALALDPKLVLADEPTAHLDHVQVEGVLRIIRGLTDGPSRSTSEPGSQCSSKWSNGRTVWSALWYSTVRPVMRSSGTVSLRTRGRAGCSRRGGRHRGSPAGRRRRR
jgi:putative ABC transport system ATP-binding protein